MEKNFLNLVLAAGTYFKNLKKAKQTAIIAKDTRLVRVHIRTRTGFRLGISWYAYYIL